MPYVYKPVASATLTDMYDFLSLTGPSAPIPAIVVYLNALDGPKLCKLFPETQLGRKLTNDEKSKLEEPTKEKLKKLLTLPTLSERDQEIIIDTINEALLDGEIRTDPVERPTCSLDANVALDFIRHNFRKSMRRPRVKVWLVGC